MICVGNDSRACFLCSLLFFLFSFGSSFASCFVNVFERTQMVVILLYVPKYSAE